MPLTRDEQKELVHLIAQLESTAQDFTKASLTGSDLDEECASLTHDHASVALFKYLESLVEK